MIESIRDEFMTIVDECDWMDAETREDAKRKARNMEVYMGFPEYILDPVQLDKEYEHVSVGKLKNLDCFSPTHFFLYPKSHLISWTLTTAPTLRM